MTDDFTLAGYGALLDELINRGYTVSSFADAEPDKQHLILRHDIDLSLAAALPMAEFEQRSGLKAAYFVLVRGDLYNPFDRDGLTVLRRLLSQGHEVGLHFDASLYDETGIEDAVARECAVLESMLETKVLTVSFHRPAPQLVGRAGRVAGRRHTYEPCFVEEMGYCSDSRGGWHRGAPLAHPAIAAGQSLQLLTHPIWWQGGNPAATLDRFLDTQVERLDKALAANCAVHLPARVRIVR